MIDLSPLDRHAKIGLSFSGGKDSLAVIYLLRTYLDRVTIYHLDTGDLLPEIQDVVAHVREFAPNFVHIQGDIHYAISRDGAPTDLLPHTSHPIGQAIGEQRVRLTPRYDCCWRNIMWPLFHRIVVQDKNTLLIRGTKSCDTPLMATRSGEVHEGVELFLPIESWSHRDVLVYLEDAGAPIAKLYRHLAVAPDCARCTAWWGERRAEYLREYYPELWTDYRDRLALVAQEIIGPVDNLRHELKNLELY